MNARRWPAGGYLEKRAELAQASDDTLWIPLPSPPPNSASEGIVQTAPDETNRIRVSNTTVRASRDGLEVYPGRGRAPRAQALGGG